MTDATAVPISRPGDAIDPRTERSVRGVASRLTTLRMAAGAVALTLALAACGGGDDDDDAGSDTTEPAADGTTTTAVGASSTTVPVESTTTAAPTPTSPQVITEGAIVVVANASRVDGGAGRLSERLTDAGFTTGTPANSSEGPLEVTRVYFNASVPEAEAVARSVVASLGGGAIELLPMPTPAPVDTGDIADATVLVAMGNDVADKTLDELQGIVTTTTAAAESTTTAAGATTTTSA